MKRKIIGLFVCMLLTASIIIPAQGTIPPAHDITQNTGATSSTDDTEWWPMFHHDLQLTGYTPSGSPSTDNKLWDRLIENDVWFSSPAIANDDLLIGIGHRYYKQPRETSAYQHLFNTELFRTDTSFPALIHTHTTSLTMETGKVYRLNAQTGEILWTFETYGSVFSSPVIDSGRAYIVSADSNNFSGRLYCVNIDTGTEIWSLPVMNGFTSPAVSGGRLYLLTFNPDTYIGKLQCLNTADGSEIWNHTTGYIDFSLYTSPALADGNVFFTSVDVTSGIQCKVSCLNQTTGQLLWATRLSEMDMGYALSSPVIANHKAYIISAQTQGYDEFWTILTCCNTTTGAILWNYTMKENSMDEVAFSSPAVAYGNVYFASVSYDWAYGKIMCLNGENGSVQWVYKSSTVYTSSSPVVSDGKVFVGGVDITLFEGNLYCYDAYNGSPLYTAFVDNDLMDSSPAIAADTVFICSVRGRMCAFRDPFTIGEIRGGLCTVKTDIANILGTDVENIHYDISVVGGLFGHINTQVNDTIEILEANTSDTIRASPILGLGNIQITFTVTMEGILPVVKRANGVVLGIFVIVK
jgi:outer membrane protein assembly factor BamB